MQVRYGTSIKAPQALFEDIEKIAPPNLPAMPYWTFWYAKDGTDISLFIHIDDISWLEIKEPIGGDELSDHTTQLDAPSATQT